ncbi:MAG: hypothetical protein H7A25_04310 [Leptospiraceae bacterium]|nr:hypothetical protein [Leptospiraceae bacterium]MCP5499100.1 hypothetical protein [Leptospiraceae bacterium]
MANQKKILGSKEIESRLDEFIQRNYLHLHIRGLTRDTRDLVSNLVNGILDRIGADPLCSFHLFSGLMEALLNALKGNLRYIIYKDEILKKLIEVEKSREELDQILQVILDTSPLRDAMQRYIIPEKIKKLVQTILSLEEKIRVKKVELKEGDKDLLFSIRQKIKEDDAKIVLKVYLDEEHLLIVVKNDAPVMDTDLERIEVTRRKHYELYKEGKSAEFFRPEHLDEKESAGFGIAMIDEGYYNMNLNPLELFSYKTDNRTTTVFLKYPLQRLQEGVPFM